MRKRNTKAGGGDWTQAEIDAVWRKANKIKGYDPDIIRQDCCDTWIRYSEHGENVENGFGWEIDHIKPVALEGTDNAANLQPLQWENNRKKGDNWPNWKCAKIAT
jgi:hypothetical protein